MNAIAAILASLKTWPEPPSLELDGKEPLELAEFHARLGEIGRVVSELKKLAATDLAEKLDGKALRYGEDVYRPSNGRGSAKVAGDPEAFWYLVADGVKADDNPAALLASLFPVNSVRLTAIPKLAAALCMDPKAFRDTFFDYDPPTSPLSVMPRSKAPKFLQDMEEGEVR